jgi:uncharacterized protein YndB with AHSA1/START domain
MMETPGNVPLDKATVEIEVSKTVDAPIGKTFLVFQNPTFRSRWLQDPKIQIQKTIENKRILATWVDGTSVLEIRFFLKSLNQTQVVVRHSKLPSARAATRLTAYWIEQLGKLKETLEGRV